MDINPLSFTSFAHFFCHLVRCLFILLMTSFTVQKLLSLIRFHLFIFAFFFPLPEETGPKNIAMICVRKSILLMCSKSFIFSGLTFTSLVHLEFILYMVLENDLRGRFIVYKVTSGNMGKKSNLTSKWNIKRKKQVKLSYMHYM